MKKLLLTLMGVSAMVTALFAQAPADLSVCYGKGYTLNSTAAAPPFGATSYSWYEDGVALPESNSASLTVAAEKEPGDYAYVRVASNDACPEGIASNTFTVRVLPAPTDLSLTASTVTICKGESATLTASATGAASYSLNGTDWQPETEFTVWPESSKSYSLYVKTAAGCVATAHDAAAVPVNLPATPVITASASSVCPNVALRVWVTSPVQGATYTWAASAGTSSSNSYTFNTATAGAKTATVYSKVTAGGVTCQSAATTVSRTVNPTPIITLRSATGTINQTVNPGTQMTAISYTASNSAVISRTGGTFTTGITGKANGSSYTISGIPTVISTYGYTLTAVASGCSSTAASGTITVKCDAPPDAFSCDTWVFGSQIWSDRIVAQPTSCASVTTLSTVTATSPPAQYKIYDDNGVVRYYYNWTCVNAAGTATLCPSSSGWRVPSQSDFSTLVNNTNALTLSKAWGYGGMANGSKIESPSTYGLYWSSTPSARAVYILRYYGSALSATNEDFPRSGFQVRCVK